MNKLRLFLENILIYGFGGIIQKIIPLIMVPIITRLMPDSTYFGISDMANTITSFCSSLAIMGMYDAMFRLFFEKDEDKYKEEICSTALVFTLCTSLAVFLVMLMTKEFIAEFFLASREYVYIVYLTAIATLVGATNSIISAPTRMQNKRKIFLVTNTVSPIISYAVAIPLLLSGHYVIALPLAGVISSITLEITFYFLNYRWFALKKFRFEHFKQLLAIAVPLLPNFLVYWVFNSSDKLMITNILEISYTGIYSVGAKLGSASQLIYTAFAGGWQYFAFSTMKEDNQVKSNSMVFEYLGTISFGCSMFIFALAHPIYQLLFTGDYVNGYIVSPYLFLAPLLQMLFQIAANQFLVVKKTWPNIIILSMGAIANVALNLYLIPKMGIEGAAVATMLGYIISDIVCVIVLYRMKLIVLSRKFMIAVLAMISYIFLWRKYMINSAGISLACAILCNVIFIKIYRKDLMKLGRMIKTCK